MSPLPAALTIFLGARITASIRGGRLIKQVGQADNRALATLEFEAGPEQERFDRFLALRLPHLSLTRIRRAIVEGDARVNGAAAAKGVRLGCGDRVRITFAPDERSSVTPEPMALDILYEDPEVIVINKPVGLLAHPSRTEKSGTLTNALAYHFLDTAKESIRPGLIHRLDRDTSGAMVVAKTARAHRILSKAFRLRRVTKRYLGLVTGQVAEPSGEIAAPIGRDPEAWPRWRVMSEGRPAETRYQVRRRFAGYTLLELEPLTGRTHQLRIHCAWLGHPVTGDRIYGAGPDLLTGRLGLNHHLLHAHYLAFRQPTSGRELEFIAPPSAQMARALEVLEAEAHRGAVINEASG